MIFCFSCLSAVVAVQLVSVFQPFGRQGGSEQEGRGLECRIAYEGKGKAEQNGKMVQESVIGIQSL